MTWIPVKTPKPPVRAKRTRAPLRPKKRMKSRNAKRKGSSFPKRRNWKYRRWIWTENPCLLAGRQLRDPVTINDRPPLGFVRAYQHVCFGANTPAHVGDTQARGAPDFGVLVPLCEGAHHFYDNRRWDWKRVTGYSEKQMASEASGFALRYVERGGEAA